MRGKHSSHELMAAHAVEAVLETSVAFGVSLFEFHPSIEPRGG